MRLTMSGSMGSGSVPVIPSAVGEEELLDVGEDVEVRPVPEANARPTGPVNSTRSRTHDSFRTAYLDIGRVSFSSANVR